MSELAVTETEREVRRFLKSRFAGYRDEVGSNDSLERVVDSLGLFDLVEWVEKRFHARIPNEEFSPRRFATISAICESVERFRK